MRDYPSVVYLRNHNTKSNSGEGRRDVTLAVKVEEVAGEQFLVAAISIVHPSEALVTEQLKTVNGLDSFPSPVNPPKGKFPFVKKEGRDNVLLRMESAILLLNDKKASFRGVGMVAVANNHSRITDSYYYREILDLVHCNPGEVFPLLSMSKAVLIDTATGLFCSEDTMFHLHDIDIGLSFNSTEV